MGTTPIYALPFPDVNDSPNGPDQVQNLAEATEAVLAAEVAALTELATEAKLIAYPRAAPLWVAAASVASGALTTMFEQVIADPGFTYKIGWFGFVLDNANAGGIVFLVTVDDAAPAGDTGATVKQTSVNLTPAGFLAGVTDATYTGAHTLRLLERNSSGGARNLPGTSPYTYFQAFVIPA